MFFNKHYAQASIAFQRAGRNREAAICDAYLLREKAQLMSTTISAARVQAFVTAANAFTTCAQDSPSKQINERLAYYGAAGECYSEARDLKHAGDSYQMAKKYATAARMYQEGGYFDKMVEIITQHNNALEVAEIHAKNGDMLKAVEILIASQAPRSADYVRLTIEYLLTGLRRSLTLGVPPASSPTVLKLLLHADKLDNGAMTEQEVNEVSPSYQFDLQVSYPSTSSSQCFKRSSALITQASEFLPRNSLGWGTTLPLCYAWTIPSHRLPSYEISRFQRLKDCSLFTSTISNCWRNSDATNH